MITTQSTVQNTASKRRESIHKDYLAPSSSHRVQYNSPASHVQLKAYAHPRAPDKSWKTIVVELFPASVQQFLPEVDVKITLLCLVWYVTSCISSNISKAILREFPHPVGLTELQFLTNASLCLLFITIANFLHRPCFQATRLSVNMSKFPEGILPGYLGGSFKDVIKDQFLTLDRRVFVMTFPMGIFQFVGHITSYKAISMIPVSLVNSVKALSPIITVCWYRFAKKKRFNPMTYYTLIPLISGVILTSSSSGSYQGSQSTLVSSSQSEGSFAVGLFFAALSMTIFVSQNIFAKSILTVRRRELLPRQKASLLNSGDSSYQLDKITILFYCSCIGFVLTLPVFITREILASSSVFGDFSLRALCLVAIYGITHFLQAMLAFQLLGMLSTVNYSIASIMKRIMVIGVALVWESRLWSTQILGLFLTMLGLYGYDKWGNKSSSPLTS